MPFKYTLESFHPTADVRPWSGDELKKNTALLNRLVALWGQLDDAEEVYDKPFGLKMHESGPRTDFFRKRILASSGYAIYDGDKAVGFCMVKDSEYENTYFISTLVIDEAYRGQHYGQTLLDYIFQVRKGQHVLLRVSMNNKAGLALYKKCGFVPMTQVMFKK